VSITDVRLAQLHLRLWSPEPGEYHAPAAVVTWNGHLLTCQPTGAPLDPAAAVLCPALARALAGPTRTLPPTPAEPMITALVADYAGATAPLQSEARSVVPEERFLARLNDGCRRCGSWKEADRDGRGRCDTVFCACTRRLLWLADEVCPAGKWAA